MKRMQRRLTGRRLDRRTFLRFSATGGAALAAGSLLHPAAPRRSAAQGRGPLTGALETGFTPVPAALAFGAVADLAAGWDGTLWATDAAGAPSVYDPVAQEWVLHGTGVDAVAWAGVPGAGAIASGTATPTAIPAATVAPPPLVPPTAVPTVAPPPLAPATPAATVAPPPLTPAVPTVAPPPLSPASTVAPPPLAPPTVAAPPLVPAGAESDEGQVVPIALVGAPAEQVAPLETPAGTPAPVAPPLAATTPVPTVAPPPLAPATPAAPPPLAATTPAAPATPATVRTPLATATPGGTPTAAHTPTAATTPAAIATGTPGALGAAASGYFLFRGSEVLYLPHTALSGVAAAAAGAPATVAPPPLTVATPAPVATATGPAAVATAAPAAVTPARTVPLSSKPAGVAVPLTPGVPQQIGALWPDLPASFQLGVRGAADAAGVLYLFKGGRYVRADGAIPPANLSDVSGWPQTPAWKDGAIDLVGSGRGDGQVLLVRGDEYLVLDLAQPAPRVAAGPAPLSAAFGGAFLAALQSPGGAEAVLFDQTVAGSGAPWVFQGPAVAGFDRAGAGGALQWRQYVAAHYGPSWPATWNPLLAQAPSGRVGDLWTATTAGAILHHDGATWAVTPGRAHSVSAGADGSAYCVGVDLAQHNLYRWNPTSGDWDTLIQNAPQLDQVSVGDASQVWLRDTANAVHRLQEAQGGQGAQLAPVPELKNPVHLAATADGTVWSCDGSQHAASRLLSGGSAPLEAIAAAGPVQKVVSTGFGAAHVLVGQGAQAQLYRYESPYVFKTAESYLASSTEHIEPGLGNLYLSVQVRIGNPIGPDGYWEYYVVSLDPHTGRELSRSDPAPSGTRYTGPVFDPVHEVVIVGLVRLAPTAPASEMRGLDARNLKSVRWSFAPQGSDGKGIEIVGRPALQGTRLCFTDGAFTIALYDTGAAPDATPVFRWSNTFSPIPGDQYRMPQPVLSGDTVYAVCWYHAVRDDQQMLMFFKADAPSGTFLVYGNVINGTVVTPHVPTYEFLGTYPLLLANVVQGSQTRTVVYANGGNAVWQVDVDSLSAQSYRLPGAGAAVSGGFAFAGDGLWFGDDQGTLYGLNEQMQALPHTPAPLAGNVLPGQQTPQIRTTPVVYTSGAGAATQTWVFLGLFATDRSPGLVTFDPSGGNPYGILPTGSTTLSVLSPAVADGVLYAAGAFAETASGGAPGGEVPQVFGVRVDEIVQGLRDFVAESQLLQDFDPAPAGHPAPANTQGSARYQTHLTVLDDVKAPRPGTPVKIWADAPATIQVNGITFQVGPGDGQFAAAQSGADGVVTIVSGDIAGTGQDKADVNAVPLRVWAPFMDPYERIVVFPDREFHNRLATAHATTNQNDPAYADPTRINLQTAQSYGPLQRGGAPTGPPLFTSDEKQQQPPQPQQAANAIQTMTTAVGNASLAALVPAAAGRMAGRGRARPGAAWVRRVTDTPGAAGKYLAYDDLPGAHFAAANTPSPRPAVVLQTAGLSYSREAVGAAPPGGAPLAPTAPPVFRPLTPAAAAAAIDALDGTPWEQSPHAPPHVRAAAQAGAVRGVPGASLGGWWSDFWNWLKRAAAAITHFLVSVAEDIYVGLRLIVEGVAYVFKQIVHVIEEVAHAIGALFLALAKAIEKVVEALSVLFHFQEIFWTHQFLRDQLLARINGSGGTPGFAQAITQNVIPKLDGLFAGWEKTITDDLNTLANRISGGGSTAASGAPALNGILGTGATAHSTFTVTPKSGGPPSSHAPQCTWGMQKLSGAPGGGSPPPTLAAPAALTAGSPVSDALAKLYGDLVQDVNSDAQRQHWQDVQAGLHGLGRTSSAGDFLHQLLADLLRALAKVLDAALVVGNTLVDKALGVVASLLSALFDPQQGYLAAPLDIPVLSWLYRLITGEPLTILNAVTLVCAIPVTVLWRVVQGQYPSQSLPRGASARQGAVGADDSLKIVQQIMGVFGGVARMVAGIAAAFRDAEGESPPPEWVPPLLVTCITCSLTFSLPLWASPDPSPLAWASWGVSIVTLLPPLLAYLKVGDAVIGAALISAINAVLLAIWIAREVEELPSDLAGNLAMAGNLMAIVPGLLNVVRLIGPEGAELVAVADVVGGLAGGAFEIAAQFVP